MDEVRVCPRCRRAHPVEIETCESCGEPLTTVSRVIGRHGQPNPPRWLKQVRGEAAELKEREARASEERMEHFRDLERRRVQAIAEARVRQEAKDRKLLLVTGGLLALFIIALLITSVILVLTQF